MTRHGCTTDLLTNLIEKRICCGKVEVLVSLLVADGSRRPAVQNLINEFGKEEHLNPLILQDWILQKRISMT